MITTVQNAGNCYAGAGGVAVAVAANAMKTQSLPARLNTTGADGLNADAAPARGADLRHALVFTTSQGGQNVALVLRSMD